MPREVEEEKREIAQKSAEKTVVKSIPDDCAKSPSPLAGPVPIPYPNTSRISDTSSSSKTVNISDKEVETKSSYTKSTGDEAGHSTWNDLTNELKKANTYKILKVPIWIWGVGLIILLVILFLLTSNTLRPIEPIDEPLYQLGT